ncbi:uncharacterized protein LOC143015028 [Genypterus blacodes]|uniref:uncharacterized protein LOC143015028 n=1 Tax=Genypterus blacodes TaxID=154954 RepID=UPI003F75D292
MFPKTSRGEKHLNATPATGYGVPLCVPAIRMTPDPEAVKEEAQNLAKTPWSAASPGIEQDTTISYDGGEEEEEEEEEEDCYSTASTSSSSLPTPEIFRDDNDVASHTFPSEMGPYRHVINSTLLDVSDAKNIHMYQQPNLSTITDVSIIPAGKECEIRQLQVEPKISRESLKSTPFNPYPGNKAPIRKTPTKLPQVVNRRSIICKKVQFKSLLVTKRARPANTPLEMSSPAKQLTADVGSLSTGEVILTEDTQGTRTPPMAMIEQPVKTSLRPARIFDFGDDTDGELFFKAWRDRRTRLQSIPSFPLTAARPREV